MVTRNDLSSIMRNAHRIKKMIKCTMSKALILAWQEFKVGGVIEFFFGESKAKPAISAKKTRKAPEKKCAVKKSAKKHSATQLTFFDLAA